MLVYSINPVFSVFGALGIALIVALVALVLTHRHPESRAQFAVNRRNLLLGIGVTLYLAWFLLVLYWRSVVRWLFPVQ